MQYFVNCEKIFKNNAQLDKKLRRKNTKFVSIFQKFQSEEF